MLKISKSNAKEVGIQVGGIATGMVAGNAAYKVIPKINDTVDMIVPFAVSGAGTIGAMMVKQPFAKAALIGLSLFSLFKGSSMVVTKLSTPNAEGKAVISASLKSGIDYVLPSLGNDLMIPVAGIGIASSDLDLIKPTIDLAGDEDYTPMEEVVETEKQKINYISLVG